MKKLIQISSILCFIVWVCVSCHREEPPIQKFSCPNGYDIVGDTACQCPPQNTHHYYYLASVGDTAVTFAKVCRPLEKGEYYGIGECYIRDSIFMYFDGSTAILSSASNPKGTGIQIPRTTISFVNKDIYQTPTGDSLRGNFGTFNGVTPDGLMVKDSSGDKIGSAYFILKFNLDKSRASLSFNSRNWSKGTWLPGRSKIDFWR